MYKDKLQNCSCNQFHFIGTYKQVEKNSSMTKNRGGNNGSEYIASTLHEDLCIFMIISRAVRLTVRTVSDKYFRENHNTQFMFNTFHSPPRPENRALCEIMWKNIVQPGMPQITT